MPSDQELQQYAPCPTCKQYSHSIGCDALAAAFNHFRTMYAHPMRGTPMGHIFDEETRDAAQLLMAAARQANPEVESCGPASVTRDADFAPRWQTEGDMSATRQSSPPAQSELLAKVVEALTDARGGIEALHVLIKVMSGEDSIMAGTFIERIDAVLNLCRGGEDGA